MNNITMPAPIVVQYHAALAGPVGGERRLHVVFSLDGVLWHAFLSEERFRDGEPFDRAIDVRITRIRKKVEPDPARPTVIRTVRGVGYMFSPD